MHWVPDQESAVHALLSLQLHVHVPQVRFARQTWAALAHPVTLQLRVLPVVQIPCASASTCADTAMAVSMVASFPVRRAVVAPLAKTRRADVSTGGMSVQAHAPSDARQGE